MKPHKGAIAYEAYRAHTGGKSLATGQTIPEWHELREAIQLAWIAAANAIEERVWQEVVTEKLKHTI